MATLTCNCGFSVTNPDKYQVEGEMWVHALKEHLDVLTGMTAAQFRDWLKDKDAKLSAA